MKKINFTLIVVLVSILSGMAQVTPRGFNFQAVARNDDGSPKANTSVDVVFGIFPDNVSIIPIYKEKHTVTTDQFGVFSATIGSGTPETGAFEDVPFQDHESELAVWQLQDDIEVLITRTRLLSVPYAKTAEHAEYASTAFFPAGMIIPFAGPEENIPDGWVLCDGSILNKNDQPRLFNAIGTAWGNGGGGDNFNIPDMRGVFLRGVSYSATHDEDKASRTASKAGGNTGNIVGSFQSEMYHSHTHRYNDYYWYDGGNVSIYSTPGGDEVGERRNDPNRYTYSAGGNETRPDNVYVNYIIKL